jgi:hypothetical protein
MYYHPNRRHEFPLQQQARLEGLSSQRAFAQRAKSILNKPVDCAVEASSAGLRKP